MSGKASSRWTLAASIVGGVGLGACGAESPAPESPALTPSAAAWTAVPTTPATGSPSAQVARPETTDQEQIGIVECDEYLSIMHKCVAHLPTEARDSMSESLATTRRAWADALRQPGSIEALTQACSAALDAVQASPLCGR